jgi:protein TonB
MDNQTHNSENDWVDRNMASLAPPGDWYPDSSRTFAQFQKGRERHETESSPRWIRLTMAAAILASIGLVVALLPWHALWRPAPEKKGATPVPVKVEAPLVASEPTPTPPPPAPKPPLRSQPPTSAAVAAVQQAAQPAPEQGQKPAERVGPRAVPPHVIPPMSEPDYTDEARQAHIQGTIVLDVTIRADGTGKVNKVERGLGYGLDEKAIETFEKWRFEPGTLDGKPVAVQLQVTMNFHLY